jgi:hypothetical protein
MGPVFALSAVVNHSGAAYKCIGTGYNHVDIRDHVDRLFSCMAECILFGLKYVQDSSSLGLSFRVLAFLATVCSL